MLISLVDKHAVTHLSSSFTAIGWIGMLHFDISSLLSFDQLVLQA